MNVGWIFIEQTLFCHWSCSRSQTWYLSAYDRNSFIFGVLTGSLRHAFVLNNDRLGEHFDLLHLFHGHVIINLFEDRGGGLNVSHIVARKVLNDNLNTFGYFAYQKFVVLLHFIHPLFLSWNMLLSLWCCIFTRSFRRGIFNGCCFGCRSCKSSHLHRL